MRLQDVAGIAAGLVACTARIDVGDDRNAGTELPRRACLETFDAILHAGHLGLVDDRNRCRWFPTALQISLPAGISALHVVAGDVRDDFPLIARAGDVGGEDRNVRVVRFDDRAADCRGVVRRQDDGVDRLGDEVFDLALLLGVIAIGVDDDQRVAVLGRLRPACRTPCLDRTAPRGSGSRRRSSYARRRLRPAPGSLPTATFRGNRPQMKQARRASPQPERALLSKQISFLSRLILSTSCDIHLVQSVENAGLPAWS